MGVSEVHDDGDARRTESQHAVDGANVPLWRSHEGLRIYMMCGSGQWRRHAHDGAKQWVCRWRVVEVSRFRGCRVVESAEWNFAGLGLG